MRFIAAILLFCGAGLAVAGCVLMALTLNTMIGSITGSAVGSTVRFCIDSYCGIEFFTGAIVVLLGASVFLALFTGLGTLLNE